MDQFARRIATAVVALLLLSGFIAVNSSAQLIPTKLPTPQGGDFGNGASASSVAGGTFLGGNGVVPLPAVAFGIPLGYGASAGDFFASLAAQRGLRGDPEWIDAAAFGGQGFGNPREWVGVELTVASYSTYRNTLRNRSLSVKAHRYLRPDLAVAVGVENAFIAGRPDGGRSVYAVASHRRSLADVQLPIREMTLTLGLGDGRFNSVQRVLRNVNKASLFGGVGLRVHEQFGVLASWNGQDLTLGASLALEPVSGVPLIITPVLLDVTGYAGDRARFALSVGAATSLW